MKKPSAYAAMKPSKGTLAVKVPFKTSKLKKARDADGGTGSTWGESFPGGWMEIGPIVILPSKIVDGRMMGRIEREIKKTFSKLKYKSKAKPKRKAA